MKGGRLDLSLFAAWRSPCLLGFTQIGSIRPVNLLIEPPPAAAAAAVASSAAAVVVAGEVASAAAGE